MEEGERTRTLKRSILVGVAIVLLAACGSTASPAAVGVPATPEATAAPTAIPTATPTPEPTATPTPEPTATPTPTPEPTPTVTALGKWATVGDWSIRFTKTNWNAWRAVHAANMFNVAPAKGMVDVMSWVEYKYNGTGRAALNPMFVLRAVSAEGVEVSQFDEPTCGVLPKPDIAMLDPTLRTGGVAKGWVCWQVPSVEAKSLRAFTAFLADFDDEMVVEFALR